MGVMVSTRTIRRTLNQAELYEQRPMKTPLLKKRHKKEQVIFDTEEQDKPQSFSENVLWTKNNLFTDSKMKLIRKETTK